MPNVIEVGDVAAERGELKKGVIKGVELVNNVSIDIPIIVIASALQKPLRRRKGYVFSCRDRLLFYF